MSPRKSRKKQARDPLEAYRRVRKPMPPPERVIPDERRRLEEEEARRAIQEGDPDDDVR